MRVTPAAEARVFDPNITTLDSLKRVVSLAIYKKTPVDEFKSEIMHSQVPKDKALELMEKLEEQVPGNKFIKIVKRLYSESMN